MTPISPLDLAVQSDADLLEHWQCLMGPDGFGRRSLWLGFFDADGIPAPTLVPIDDIPDQPEPALGASLDHIVAELRATTDIDSVAVLLTRPGDAVMTSGDRAWGRFLRDDTDLTRRWPAHLATTGIVRVFAPDDLLADRR
ncbi:hypothetical protein [Angustibacter luteus]|uniref:Uncharacterized protein n=1 Tax=Angustibacter luteus TaxID=658456 RepID=A0ABW1JAK8_9ACTN